MNADIRFDDVQEENQPVVAIQSRWAWLGYLSPLIIVVLSVLLLFPDRSVVHPVGEPWLVRYGAWILFFVMMIGGVLAAVPLMLKLGGPEFAILTHGMKIPYHYWSSYRSMADPYGFGFVEWERIRWCHWSPYDVGLLSIQLESMQWHSRPMPLTRYTFNIELPSMLIQYRVPKAYRERVEAAIRACGKWGE